MTENGKGAFFMMGSMAAFTLNDTFMKIASADLPLMQALVVRGAATILILTFVAYRSGVLWPRLRGRDRMLVLLRSIAEVGAAYFFLTALFNMPIANVTAVLQVMPLAVTLAAAIVFKEPIGWRRLLAILIGFCGVMLIIRPGPDGFNIYALYVLIAVAFVVVRDLSARRLSRDVPSLFVALAAAVAVTIFAGANTATTEWVAMEAATFGLMILAGVLVVAGYLLSVMVMRVGDVSFVAPFRYTGLLWALGLGFLIFNEWPDPITLSGAAIVIATGLFTFWREARLNRRARRAAMAAAARPGSC